MLPQLTHHLWYLASKTCEHCQGKPRPWWNRIFITEQWCNEFRHVLCFRIKFSNCDNSFDLSEMLPRPRTPSPSACCGNGCSPCVMDLHEQVGFVLAFVFSPMWWIYTSRLHLYDVHVLDDSELVSYFCPNDNMQHEKVVRKYSCRINNDIKIKKSLKSDTATWMTICKKSERNDDLEKMDE